MAGQPVNAPRPLDSCIVMRWSGGTQGASRWLRPWLSALSRLLLPQRLRLRHPVSDARLGEDVGGLLASSPRLRRRLFTAALPRKRSASLLIQQSVPHRPDQDLLLRAYGQLALGGVDGLANGRLTPLASAIPAYDVPWENSRSTYRHNGLGYRWTVDLKPAHGQEWLSSAKGTARTRHFHPYGRHSA